jgi:hypothetical protein
MPLLAAIRSFSGRRSGNRTFVFVWRGVIAQLGATHGKIDRHAFSIGANRPQAKGIHAMPSAMVNVMLHSPLAH